MCVNNQNRSGFTLVEIAVVIVVIGLITASVLVGKDLIEAATVRAAISQTQQYQLAVKTFRIKYNGLPGDLVSATSLGFTARSNHGTGVVNGNGLLESTMDNITNQSTTVVGYELLLLWSDLSMAGMINTQHTVAADTVTPAMVIGVDASTFISDRLPTSKLGNGNFYFAFSSQGINYFQLAKALGISAGSYFLDYGITPSQAFNIDKKLDDGLPLTGAVNGLRHVIALGAQCAPGATGNRDACCGDNTGGNANIYNTVTSDLANTPACQLQFRFN